MRTTSTRRTARLVAVLATLPLAAVLAVGGSSATAGEAVKLGPVHASTVQGPFAPAPTTVSDNSANTGTVTTYDPSVQDAGQGGTPRGYSAGIVGNADRKQPKGQRLSEADAAAAASGTYAGRKGNINGGNNGYECGGNNGIGQGNPAHSGCLGAITVD